jgi:hypothetical protein
MCSWEYGPEPEGTTRVVRVLAGYGHGPGCEGPPERGVPQRHTQRAGPAAFTEGYDDRTAATVAEGIDPMLPDGGEEVLRRVRQSSPETRVVVTTGLRDEERLGQLRQLHPDAVLSNPTG